MDLHYWTSKLGGSPLNRRSGAFGRDPSEARDQLSDDRCAPASLVLPNLAVLKSRRLRRAPPRPATLVPGCGPGGPTRYGGPGIARTIRRSGRHISSGVAGAAVAIFLGNQCPSHGHRVKGASGVTRDRFATLDPLTAYQGFGAYEEHGGGQGIRVCKGSPGISLEHYVCSSSDPDAVPSAISFRCASTSSFSSSTVSHRLVRWIIRWQFEHKSARSARPVLSLARDVQRDAVMAFDVIQAMRAVRLAEIENTCLAGDRQTATFGVGELPAPESRVTFTAKMLAERNTALPRGEVDRIKVRQLDNRVGRLGCEKLTDTSSPRAHPGRVREEIIKDLFIQPVAMASRTTVVLALIDDVADLLAHTRRVQDS